MSFTVLTQKSLSLFAAMGGWRAVAEGLASRLVFLVGYALTGRILTSALLAVGAVAVFAAVRLLTDRKYWSVVIGLVMVGVSALLAGGTGQAANFYLQDVLTEVVPGTVCLVSMLVRWPLVGLIVGGLRAERLGWRRDRVRRRRYQVCTAIFLAKFGVVTAVLAPLYLARLVIPLGIATALLPTPGFGVCAYLCWRILRTQPTANPVRVAWSPGGRPPPAAACSPRTVDSPDRCGTRPTPP